MRILTISGSTRYASSNARLLRALGSNAPDGVTVVECKSMASLPIFNQDLEHEKTPDTVKAFCREIDEADGLVISSPEYVHAIPGGLKNAIDWLVSRDEIIRKPIALAHASHRGDEALRQLRVVLGTISERYSSELFFRIPIASKSETEAEEILKEKENEYLMKEFMSRFVKYAVSSD